MKTASKFLTFIIKLVAWFYVLGYLLYGIIMVQLESKHTPTEKFFDWLFMVIALAIVTKIINFKIGNYVDEPEN